jgi:hypothetical protein
MQEQEAEARQLLAGARERIRQMETAESQPPMNADKRG